MQRCGWTLVLPIEALLTGGLPGADTAGVGILRFSFARARACIVPTATVALAAACLAASPAAAGGLQETDRLSLTASSPSAGASAITVEVHSDWRRKVAIEQSVDGAWLRLATTRPGRRGLATANVELKGDDATAKLRARIRPRGLVSATITVARLPGGTAPAEQQAPAAGSPVSPDPADILVGFNNNAVTDRVATAGEAADLLADAGADVDRVQISWKRLEPQDGQYDFAVYDAIYAADIARGVRPLFIFAFAPDWASTGVCDGIASGCHAPPARAHYDDAAETVAEIARRYPEAAGIEIWNEPNTPYFWRPAPDPAAYAELLDVSMDAVRAVDPGMPVAGGSMASGAAGSVGKISAPHFLQAMYQSPTGAAPDAISVHVYPDPTAESAVAWVERLSGIRDAFGSSETPIWITETGVSTTGPGAMSEDGQASMLAGLDAGLRSVPGVEMLLFHTLVEPPRGSSSPETGFGVVGAGLRRKPAYCSLASAWGRPDAC